MQLGAVWCNLVQLGEYLNSIHSNIKFTHEYSVSLHQSLPFLDVQVHLSNNQIHPDLHAKSTDKHQYLLKSSFHPITLTTRENYPIQPPSSNTPYISTNYVFDQRRKKLANYLMKRGYSRRFLQRAITRVRAIPRHETLKQQEHTNSTTDRTPFVSTFTPLFRKFLRF